ncbi:hypothetical protein D3C79_871900 [compost metagenome]
MFDHGLTVVAIAEAARSIAEISVVAGFVDDHVVGKTEGNAVGLCGQGHQASLGVEGQQAFDGIGDHQQAIGMPGQAQWPATGIGQDFSGLAVQARTDQAPVVQAGDERVVFQ